MKKREKQAYMLEIFILPYVPECFNVLILLKNLQFIEREKWAWPHDFNPVDRDNNVEIESLMPIMKSVACVVPEILLFKVWS